MIEVKHLTKKYGSHLAVDDLSFTIEEGRIYGFLGPNGAGKSTTMNIMTGYLGPTSGEVIIQGHDILEEPREAKSCIGYLPEQPPLYMDMTVLEYLKFVADLKEIPRSSRWDAIEEAMEKVGITEMEDRLIKNLSKGYKQRVGLAQAILGMPPIIILDEPTVGLDPKQILEIRDLIRQLGKEHTVILSSHILSEIREVCDHIMIIAHGKLVASDTTENLMEQKEQGAALRLKIKGSADAVKTVLKARFNRVEVTGEDGVVDASASEVKAAKGKTAEEKADEGTGADEKTYTDIREELFYALAEARLPILEMTQDRATLEQLFLELTQAEKDEKGGEE